MSRTADVTLSGWVLETKIEAKSEFIQLYYDKGPLGFYIYVLMRNIICGQGGYYAILNESLIATIHCKLGRWTKPIKFIKELIEYFGEVGILDKSLLKDNILTSADIQRTWLNAKKLQRTQLKNVDLKHWLLVDTLPAQTENDTCSDKNDNCSDKNDTCSKKELSCTQDPTQPNNTKLNAYIEPRKIIDLYCELCGNLIPYTGNLTKKREIALMQNNNFSKEDYINLFRKANESEFLQGHNESGFKASFDWVIKPENIAKILNGNYDKTFTKKANSAIISDKHNYTQEELDKLWNNDDDDFDF